MYQELFYFTTKTNLCQFLITKIINFSLVPPPFHRYTRFTIVTSKKSNKLERVSKVSPKLCSTHLRSEDELWWAKAQAAKFHARNAGSPASYGGETLDAISFSLFSLGISKKIGRGCWGRAPYFESTTFSLC